MVLFKRKPVAFLPRPAIEDDDKEVWIIPETQELFFTYESYLQRMDWYKAKKFICEISGHSGLSFFDALKSETAGAREVEGTFPEPLKSPVLRKVQFSTISRIDNLVDKLYDDFKSDFYPGEHVSVMVDGERHNAVVRDKACFPEIKDPETGEISRESFTRYFVKVLDKTGIEALVDDAKVSRDRKTFTKQMLRSFIKNTVTREAWNGAPWLVKPEVADMYRIDTRVPLHLQYGHKVAEKKERKRAEQAENNPNWSPGRLPDLKPLAMGRRPSLTPSQIEELHQQNGWPTNGHDWPPGSPPARHDAHQSPHSHSHYMVNGHPQYSPHSGSKQLSRPVPVPLPPPIKYPIEDMDCPPLRNGAQRPAVKYVTSTQAGLASEEDFPDRIPGLLEHNVELLLETWNTLNVYCQVLKLDSFTFDDFVGAMLYKSLDADGRDCDLLTEIHCAVLKVLVNASNDQNGAIQIALPDLPATEVSEEEDDQEESRISYSTPEPDVPARRTRSSLNKMMLAEEEKADEDVPEVVPHRGAELCSVEDGWIERLRRRDFTNGGWQYILAGLLNQVAGRPRLKLTCTRVLTHLVPLDVSPTESSCQARYDAMDVNLRAEALQVICQLFLETRAVKTFLEEMAHTMTQFRKLKIEHQKARKEAVAVLKRLNDDRKILAPLERSPTPVPELEELDVDELEKLADASIADSDDEVDSDGDRRMSTRSLRRGNDRAAERKRKREEEEERKALAKEEKHNKGSKEYQKILKAIEKERAKIHEHETQIEIVDGDLREADAYRTRCLGKDRFCNRYWWFERNAMPFGGLPDSSTADTGYANGRLWVQGPDEMERLGYIDVPAEAKNNYYRCFQMTPADRKRIEEGSTNLHHAHQWGFYDTVEEVEKLIAWLDSRGVRELKLKKELCLYKDKIGQYMLARQDWFHPELKDARHGLDNGDDDSDEEAEDEQVKAVPTRQSSRRKLTATPPASELPDEEKGLLKRYPCLRWRNTTAIRELGRRHADPPPSKNSRKAKKSGGFEAVNGPAEKSTPSNGFMSVNEGRTTRGAAFQAANPPPPQTSRSGRAVGRRGATLD